MVTLNTLGRRKSKRRSRFINPTSVSTVLLVLAIISVASWRVTKSRLDGVSIRPHFGTPGDGRSPWLLADSPDDWKFL